MKKILFIFITILWCFICNGQIIISPEQNTILITDTLHIGKYVRAYDTLTAQINSEIEYIDYRKYFVDPLIDYTGSSYPYLFINRNEVTFLENENYRMGRLEAQAENLVMTNYNDSVRVLQLHNNILTNKKGYIATQTVLGLRNNMQPDGVRAKTNNMKGIYCVNQLTPSSSSGSLAISNNITNIEAFNYFGSYNTTEIGDAIGIKSSLRVDARSGANTSIDSYIGLLIDVSESQTAGTRVIGDLHGFKLVNSSSVTLTGEEWGIYEDFGKNYFKHDITTNGSVDINTTTGALIVPRMTTIQRDAIISTQNGMILYNTTTSQFNFYENGTWVTK